MRELEPPRRRGDAGPQVGFALAVFGSNQEWESARFLYFYIFENRFLHKYIFDFTIYRFIPLLPRRGAALPGGRGLYEIKICVLSHGGPYRPAGGGRLPLYKSRGPP